MKNSVTKRLATIVTTAVMALAVAFGSVPAMNVSAASSGVDMYRLYNKTSGEHFYTANAAEKSNLISAGWKYEGIGWVAPAKSNTPVYRLYNPNSGDHHYTVNVAEKNMLTNAGWKYEGIGWYSDDSKRVPLYREYNPNAKTGSHNYTTSSAENAMLVKNGWKAESIGWYGVEAGRADNSVAATQTTANTDSEETVYDAKWVAAQRAQTLAATNAERAKVGAPALIEDPELDKYAQIRAEECAVKFSHTRPNGYSDIRPEDGINLPRTTAIIDEIIDQGHACGAGAVEYGWMHSEPHRESMLGEDATLVGIGCVNGVYVEELAYVNPALANFVEPDYDSLSRDEYKEALMNYRGYMTGEAEEAAKAKFGY